MEVMIKAYDPPAVVDGGSDPTGGVKNGALAFIEFCWLFNLRSAQW